MTERELLPGPGERTLYVMSLMTSWKSLFKTVSIKVHEEILCPSEEKKGKGRLLFSRLLFSCYLYKVGTFLESRDIFFPVLTSSQDC